MTTLGLDHVNLLTEDLEGTVAFYETVLGLTRDVSPAAAMAGISGAWMRDAGGKPIVHLVVKDGSRPAYDNYIIGQPTGAVHHVAFECEGFRETVDRLTALGFEIAVNDGILGLHQIILTDPNGVNVEMNFAAA